MIRLNLLPPKEKGNLKLEEIQRWIWVWTAALTLALVFFLIVLATIYFSLISGSKAARENYQFIQQSAQGETLKSQQDLINNFNDRLARIASLQEKHKYYSQALIEILSLLPSGIRLESLVINEKKQVTLSGFAPDREKIIVFKEALEKSNKFENIENPLSNLLKQTDINFYFKFDLTDRILKKL